MFGLYADIINPLKNLESEIDKQEQLEADIAKAKETLHHPILTVFVITFGGTVALAIPFIIIFLIVAFTQKTADGIRLWDIYDAWAGSWAVTSVLENWISGFENIIILLILTLLEIAGYILLAPIIVFLLPAMFVLGIPVTIFLCLAAASTKKTAQKELPNVERRIADMYAELALPLSCVPPDYRYSAALEHFCRSYYNGKASSLKEAVLLYDEYVHRQTLEKNQEKMIQLQKENQEKIIQQHKETIKKLNNIQSKVDDIAWRTFWL